uniref:Cytochrome P450 n=1 Tax=Acrobeloides nanus TaxID=290746 RepID=A0A914CKN8_9BILA
MKHTWLQIFAFTSLTLISVGFIHFIKSTSIIQYQVYAIIVAFSCLYIFHEIYWKRRHLPPGPIPLLAAGNMLEVLLNPNVDMLFLKWRKKYGGIFTFWMGPIPMVMVSDVDTMKRYFIKNADIFSSRWRNYITETILDGFNGVVQIDGEKWREQRRFSLHVLRDFGVGRALIEEKIMNQVDYLMEHLNSYSKTQKTLDLSGPLAVCVGNIINDVLFGKTFRHDDPEFRLLHEMLDRQSSLVIKPIMGLYLVAPWTTNVPLINAPWLELISIRDALWSFLSKQLQEHKKIFNPDIEPADFTFTYLKEMYERKIDEVDMGFFSEKQLLMLLLDLFFAGMETTVTTSKWGFLMLILHPEVQARAQQELDQLPTRIHLHDRTKLVYVQAMINVRL